MSAGESTQLAARLMHCVGTCVALVMPPPSSDSTCIEHVPTQMSRYSLAWLYGCVSCRHVHGDPAAMGGALRLCLLLLTMASIWEMSLVLTWLPQN